MQIRSRLLALGLAVVSTLASLVAQEVSVPDPGLSAAIRDALQKPTDPLTAQDMLGLTTLNADSRSISNLQGLETALNRTIDPSAQNSERKFYCANSSP